MIHKIGPALAARNAVVLKPSEHAPLTPSLICDDLLNAGLPPAKISLVNGGPAVGQAFVEHPGIDFYTFTGSTAVGRLIQAGGGSRRTQLELGSIACTVVCSDAQLHKVIPKIARACFGKAGQVSISIQRLYVHRSIVPEVTKALVAEAGKLKCVNPVDPNTILGLMISAEDSARAREWIQEAVDQGAKIEYGGNIQDAVL